MKPNRSTTIRRARRLVLPAAGTGLGLVLAASVLAGTAGATPVPGPQLSISIDNGKSSVAAGDDLAYTITVKNLGGEHANKLVLSQTLPAGLTFVSADAGGVPARGRVTWQVNLKVGGSATMHTRMQVGSTSKDLLRLATVACANVADKPIVCATHSDQLPAGAAAAAAAREPDPGRSSSDSTATWVSGTAGAVALGMGAGVLVLRRRRRSAG